MSDPLSHVVPGDPLVIPASAWNDIIDLVRGKNGAGGPGALPSNLDKAYLTVRVKAGATLPNRGIVTLGDAIIDPDADPLGAARTPAFDAVAPVAGGVPAVLLSGLSSGQIGRAVVQGVCVASVVIGDAGHEYAAPVVGDVFSLASATSGPFRLLTNPGVGTAKCLVMLGPEPPAAGAPNYLAPVRVATTTAGTLATSFENGDTVDGVTLATGDAILLKNQSTASENGTYTVNASGAPTRRETLGAQFYGALVTVTNGVTNGDSLWQCTNDTVPAVGSSAIQWSRVSGASGTGTDNRIARWDGTSAIQDSDITITDAGNFVMGSGVAYFGGASSIPPAGGGAAFGFGGIEFGSACDISNVNDISGTGDFITDGTSATNGGLVRGVFVEALGVPASVAGHSIKLVTSTADGTPPQIQVTVRNVGGLSRTAYTGYSGTPGPGFTTHGGVVTSAGSGTFGDVVTTAANAFTNTNTFAPANSSTVPVTIQGAASQSANLTEWKDSGGTVLASVSAAGAISGTLDGGTW